MALSSFGGKHMHLFLRKDPTRLMEDVLTGNATGAHCCCLIGQALLLLGCERRWCGGATGVPRACCCSAAAHLQRSFANCAVHLPTRNRRRGRQGLAVGPRVLLDRRRRQGRPAGAPGRRGRARDDPCLHGCLGPHVRRPSPAAFVGSALPFLRMASWFGRPPVQLSPGPSTCPLLPAPPPARPPSNG